jgi:hypothetical protein
MSKRLYAVSSIVVTVFLLGVLYFTLSKSMSRHDSIAPRSVTFRLSVSEARVGENPPTFEAMQGDTVTLLITSDRPGRAHVHGYEKGINLVPSGEVTLTFSANYAGRFQIHLHDPNGPMRPLATLLIRPK